ncbi:wall-associated receptor kinase 2-like isoform X1 [Triticum dicoccoides]|uniref:wall-associated receptor kinase 2-like isoform X1 n=1 Tax=Triticum dicoccoides TaxID=85692 RepID=UPI00188F17AF|nr:wall-associated receptor kinase 2-like isoform X1 [Triticum dicoccoides]
MPFHTLAAVPVVLLWLGAVLAARFPLFGAASPQPSSQCQRKCGSVDIPYPFGIVNSPDDDDGHCAMNGFSLTCNDSGIDDGGRHRPFYDDVEVVGVSLQQGQARMLNDISYYCYNTTTREMDPSGSSYRWLDFAGTPFRFSDTTNKFTVIGCQTLAYIIDDGGDYGDGGNKYMSGCVAMCRGDDVMSTLSNGSCSGIGCCQTAIPRGLQYYHVEFDSDFNTTGDPQRQPLQLRGAHGLVQLHLLDHLCDLAGVQEQLRRPGAVRHGLVYRE